MTQRYESHGEDDLVSVGNDEQSQDVRLVGSMEVVVINVVNHNTGRMGDPFPCAVQPGLRSWRSEPG